MTAIENITFVIEEKKLIDENCDISSIPNGISDMDILLNDMFSMPKKKKKKDKEKIQENEIESQNQKSNENITEDERLLDEFNLNLKRHKKHKKDKEKGKEETKFSEDYDPPTYTYKNLLDRLYLNMEDNGIQIVKHKNTLKIPMVHRIGSKKTAWSNFKDCCKSIGKDEQHILNFVISELSTEANLDGNGILQIKGIYNQKNIEQILRKYVSNFAQCSVCKSLETTVRKDQNTRLSFLDCNSCKSSRTLQQIISGYKAVTKTVKFKD